MVQVALERRHWEAAGRAEDVKKELERKHVDKVFVLLFFCCCDFYDVDKVVENEGLKKTVENLERKVKIRYERARYCHRATTANDQLKNKTKKV